MGGIQTPVTARNFRKISMEKQGGMAFRFRKTAKAVIKPGREYANYITLKFLNRWFKFQKSCTPIPPFRGADPNRT
jgi:hypothetical protein